MKLSFALKLFSFGLLFLILFSIITAYAANLTVEKSNVGYVAGGVTANQLKPAECTQLLDEILSGSGTINGTGTSELILGGVGIDTINGGGGNDCIVAGGGDDVIDGGDDTDVCLGGAGTDSFSNCETETQ